MIKVVGVITTIYLMKKYIDRQLDQAYVDLTVTAINEAERVKCPNYAKCQDLL